MKMALKIFVFALLSLLLPACNAVVECCAKEGPGGKFLRLQLTSPPFILCSYGVGPTFTQCVYNGFPPQPPDCPPLVYASVCSITSVIHPRSDPTRCVTALGGGTVQLQTCNGANNQNFLFNQDTATPIRAAGTNLCLDASPIIASKVTLKTCSATTLNQIFLFSSAPTFILRTFFRSIQRDAFDLRAQVSNNSPLQKWTIFP